MVSTLSRQEKFNQVRRSYCFYLDIEDHELCRSISRRLQDMGLQQEAWLSSRVTHLVRSRGGGDAAGGVAGGGDAGPRWRREPARARADAMLERVRSAPTQNNYVLLSVDKAIALLDKLYDTFFAAPRKANIRFFTKHFIKIEFLDKSCRPLYKEFDVWPDPLNRTEKKEPALKQGGAVNNNCSNTIGQKQDMTRKNRPRIKDEKEASRGWCAACGAACESRHATCARAPRAPRAPHAPHHYLALDSLLAASLLPLNGRRPRRAARAAPPDPPPIDKQYYKVVGVSTKLRSSGGFAAKRKEESPPRNGTEPLVVKFRKVRRSELSVLSDEAEQFMFHKRASSASSSDDEEESPRRKTPPRPPPALERRRQARPTALKEESSEEDVWSEHAARRKRRGVAVVRRTRRAPLEPPAPEPEPPPPPPETEIQEKIPEPEPEVSPLREEPMEQCMKWEDGKLKYTPAVEQLEFAFESVPRSEPWFETFNRQDRDQVAVRNVPRCFALYSKSPKLPYEIGQLPPLKPNCCPLSSLPKPPPKPRTERTYGTRGLKSRALHKRAATLAAHEARPRKSPREHASTLAMLGSAGLLRRRPDDAKSTASEETVSDALSVKPEPQPSEAQEAGERLQRFLDEVFDDAAEFEVDDVDGGAIPAAAASPDVLELVSECDACDIIRNEIAEASERRARRRGRFKRKNRTGWPKKKPKKGSRTTSSEDQKTESSADRSSVESPDTATEMCDEDDATDTEKDNAESKSKSEDEAPADKDDCSDDKPLRLDVKVLLEDKKDKPKADPKGSSRSSVSESDDKDEKLKKKKRALTNLASWLQPVVRVARVDPATARRLRSAAATKTRSARLR